jgi:hypothetical protein
LGPFNVPVASAVDVGSAVAAVISAFCVAFRAQLLSWTLLFLASLLLLLFLLILSSGSSSDVSNVSDISAVGFTADVGVPAVDGFRAVVCFYSFIHTYLQLQH